MNLLYLVAADAALIPYDVAVILRYICVGFMLAAALAEIVVVLLQKPVTANIGTIAGEDTQTYAGKNKSKSKESLYRMLTIIFASVIAVFAILFFITLI